MYTRTCLYMQSWHTSRSLKINVNFCTWVNRTTSVQCRYQSSLINLEEIKIKWPSTDFQNIKETEHCLLFVKSNKKTDVRQSLLSLALFYKIVVVQNPWSEGFLHFKMLGKKLAEKSFSSLHFHCFGSTLPCPHKT